MRRLDNLNAPAVDRIAVARDHQPRQRTGPVVLNRSRHGGGGFAGTDYDQPAARRRWQVRLNVAGGLRGIDCRVEQAPQQNARIKSRVHASIFASEPIPSMVTSTLEPSGIEPTPREVPQAITSPGSSDISREIRLTSSCGANIMSDNA